MSNLLPVTVLTGVGGSDGTHALKALLRGAHDTRLTAIVPRRSHKRLRAKDGANIIPTTEKLVQLGQGCSCCTVRADLMSKIRRVASEASADHLLVHASPHTDLKTLAKTFTVADTTGAVLSDAALLENLVAVVDASSALKTLSSEAARPLIERIELANVVLLEGMANLSPEACARVEGVVRALNSEAQTLRDDQVAFELPAIRSKQPFDLRSAELRASRLGSADTDFGTSGGLSQFTYFERLPFHPERLHTLLQEARPEVIRAQGSLWVASSPDFSISLDVAGGSRQLNCEGKWWATVPEHQRPKSPGFQQYLEGLWHPDFGDRHQALTFIGVEMDKDALEHRLKQCLLTEDELANRDAWSSMTHPFSWPQQ